MERSLEYYPKHYTISWPNYVTKTERGLRKSPLYDKLKAAGAVLVEKSGWERAQWFAPEGVEPVEEPTFGTGHWEEHVGREVKALREGVVILDQTSFGKIEVRGPDALAHLQRLATRNIDKPIGTLSYTSMCNESGTIEADLTIARLAEEHFYIVTGTALVGHDLDWKDSFAVSAHHDRCFIATSTGIVCKPRLSIVMEESPATVLTASKFL